MESVTNRVTNWDGKGFDIQGTPDPVISKTTDKIGFRSYVISELLK